MDELIGHTAESKRQVPPMLKKILHEDVRVTKKVVELGTKVTWTRSLRNHSNLLEVSCHGIVWLAGWLTFIWLFNNKDFYQIQVNLLIALILDIVVIAVIKAFVRRRRPVPMNKLLEVGPDKFSFPSGHASRACLVTTLLILNDLPIYCYPPILAWMSTVCLTRILAERHYILDVLAGVGIGLLEAFLMYLLWLSQGTCASIIASLSDEKVDGGEYHV
ncbi:polyisoprenoid diphosphate/phosphate phosphohydrolase PLPP6 isoform X1 [Helicoverpa armigera]|nr:polyisoprenoid diphosphate/phosphate phosphohydrolase PLPP6 isoform X1 [Helicoverpa armigera]XP_021201133.1 polyisoprenoid diphosphate/phosphate phosphohydrolase PLPP6 isoform X1 [Helicoverpa armigera]XP_047030425.1 polyisoprenoid diphosphate/phosphate phosphohydrolase PLPP6 [Helicoverpa zea]XP_047030429.1 polyisoprenoid diphosphate/phosphate phosphohydrolase PLPP6 [Helicoverpa zea]XP_047030438.1 polyisoprenoid diphosphate/phosphate phosphohydrolase PLPP6 [Helicoverpa zea]XP_047030446.1 pol